MFTTISNDVLGTVIGGKADANEALTGMLTQISGAIKDLGNKPKDSMDPMAMMMMVMMMGKGGGGGAQQVAAAPPPEPPPARPNMVNVSVG